MSAEGERGESVPVSACGHEKVELLLVQIIGWGGKVGSYYSFCLAAGRIC